MLNWNKWNCLSKNKGNPLPSSGAGASAPKFEILY